MKKFLASGQVGGGESSAGEEEEGKAAIADVLYA